MSMEILTLIFWAKYLPTMSIVGLILNGLSLLLLVLVKDRSAVFDGQTSYGLESLLTLVGGISLTSVLAIPVLYFAGHWTSTLPILIALSLTVMGLNNWQMESRGLSEHRIGSKLTGAGLACLLITTLIWMVAIVSQPK